MLELLRRAGKTDFSNLRVMDLGCGFGTDLLELIRLGFSPANLVGNEFLEDRIMHARDRLHSSVEIVEGDAATLTYENEFDVVLISTVFTSILDRNLQESIARSAWRMLKSRGGIVWYDFRLNNPRNPDVRGVPLYRIRELFPNGEVIARRVTLIPPLGRVAARLYPWFYDLFYMMPFLRSHLMCWIGKP